MYSHLVDALMPSTNLVFKPPPPLSVQMNVSSVSLTPISSTAPVQSSLQATTTITARKPKVSPPSPQAAIVTSTSTPASTFTMICLTSSVGATISITLLGSLISNVSHVFEPSPQGVLRVVMRSVFVGMRTGPFVRSSLALARSMSSVLTFSRERTSLLDCFCN
jgi:hypothetical protein